MYVCLRAPSRPAFVYTYAVVYVSNAGVCYECNRDETCVRVGADCFAPDVRVSVQRRGCIWRRRDIEAASGGGGGRRTGKRDAFLHNRKHAVAHTRANESGISGEETVRARASEPTRYPPINTSRLNARLRFSTSRCRGDFLSLSCRRSHGMTRNLINSDIFWKRPFRIFEQSRSLLERYIIHS